MNETIFFFFYNFAHKSEMLDKIVVFAAETFPYLVLVLAGVFLLMHHEVLKAEAPAQVFMEKKREFYPLFLSVVIAWMLPQILKILFHTLRPFEFFPQVTSLFAETGYAFPSGHSAVMAAIAFSIFLIHKKAGSAFILCALVVGAARIVAGVHFPIDILGGFVVGGVVAALVAYFVKSV